MLIRNQWLKYGPVMAPADAGGDAGGGAPSAGDGDAGDPPAGDDGDQDDPPSDGAGDKGTGDGPAGDKGDKGDKGDPNKPSEREATLLKDVMSKKAQNKALRAELDKYKDVDLGEYQKFQQERADAERKAEEAEKKRLEEAGEWDRLREKINTEHDKVVADLNAQLADRDARLEAASNERKSLTVGNEFGNSPFIAKRMIMSPAKAQIIYGSHFGVNEDGQVVGYDKPAGASDRTPLVDGRGKPLSFDDALKKLVDADPDKDTLLKADIKPGAGSGGQPGATGDPGSGRPELHGVDRIKAGLGQLNQD